ncbi:MAG TPA: trypsin-like serine protease [Candidatus Limnocylindrales bacterium]|nr:trypsin-like serine protease [Candidatus Limnocylindrales bacterium]
MRIFWCSALVGGSLLLAPVQADAEQRAGHPRVVDGTVTVDPPAVGEILYSACGGTLIGCQTVLTAAHCALGDPSVFFRHLFFQHGGMVDVDLDGSTLEIGYDMAVLKLASPVTRIRPLPINRTTGSYSLPGTVVGWGCDPVPGVGESIKRSASTTVSNLFVNAVTAQVGGCSGDSGGVFLTDFGSGTVLAGTIEGTYGSGIEGPGTYYYQSLIAAAAGADINSTACGNGAQAGDPNSTTFPFSGSISAGAPQQTHSFSVAPGTTELRVAFNEEDNFNVFIRFGAPATTTTYDCRIDYNVQASLSCTFPAPQAGTWYALVNRVSGSGMYQLTATTFSDCSDALNAGIACDDGNSCTDNDVCAALACTGTPVPDMTSCGVNADSQCTTGGTCQGGICEPTIVADGTACTPSGDNAASGRCRDGSCHLACPGEPRSGCRTCERSKFTFASDADPSRKKLQWSWSRGQAVPAADLDDPRSATEYALCVYSNTGHLLATAALPTGESWRAKGGIPPRGFRFDGTGDTASGVTRADVKAGTDGKAKAAVRGAGADLPDLTLPISSTIGMTVQLVHNDPAPQCWTAQYSNAPIKNDGEMLTLSLP